MGEDGIAALNAIVADPTVDAGRKAIAKAALDALAGNSQ